MKTCLTALFQCSLSMSVITLLYAIVLPILSKRYAPKWRYMVWLVIAVAWMIPFRPLIELPFLSAQSTSTPFMPVQLTLDSPIANTTAEALTPAPGMQADIPPFSMWEIAFFLWLTGIAVILVYQILRHNRFMNMVKRWSEAGTTPEILRILDTLKQEQKIKAQIEYKTCPSISSPMMVGFFRPVILMPSIRLSEHELIFILRHELTHFKKHDLWYKTIVLAATVLHWFNPIVYFMARATSVQCEIACDALVLENEDMQMRKQYGETIIAVVRGGKAHQTALSTNFYGGKRGMKNRIVSMLDGKRKKAGVTILCIVLAGIMLTGATLVAAGNVSTTIPGTAFTDEEYGKLLALRFDSYKDMSIAEFQEKVWAASDTVEYMTLLERFSKDKALYAMKDSNEIASFLFYVLEPLAAEKWQSREFGGYATTNYDESDIAMLEYQLTMKILDANTLTVRQYNDARLGVVNELSDFFQGQTVDELQNEQSMKKTIDSEIDSLTEKWSSSNLSIEIEYGFMPLIPYDDSQPLSFGEDAPREEREYPNATEEDYRSLLELKTADYQNRLLTDFNADLLEWANQDYERMERIGLDTAYQDFNVSLAPQELSFVTLTVNYSGSENGAMIRSTRTGKPQEDIGFIDSLPEKTLEQNGRLEVWCSLYYQGSYHITDDSRVTVGERDDCIGGVISAIQKYWDNISLNELLTMSNQDMLTKLEEIASQYSNDKITISIIPDQISLDKIDERSSNE
ncbi:MAG: M56 family metallopeptidase [Lachnospiraceae bacterium]